MALLIAHITVGQAATVINILISFFQYTLGLAIVALLVYFLPAVNPALAWNVIGRKLQTSLWPTLLQTNTLRGSGFSVVFFSYLSLGTTPLPASLVADTSPLGLATSPRQNYAYGRVLWWLWTCGMPWECGLNTTVIPADIFRRYYNGTQVSEGLVQTCNEIDWDAGFHYPILIPQFATTESIILRNGIFAASGVIVDLDNPGIGLWNHALPHGTSRGATWSEDVLWLEPVSECVDTNLTIDTPSKTAPSPRTKSIATTSPTAGASYNLTKEYPTFDRDGQNIDLRQHAYKGAVLSNFYTLINLGNVTRNESYAGTFPLNFTKTEFFGGQTQPINMLYMGAVDVDNTTVSGGDLITVCEGYGGMDTANISNVAVHCNMFLGPSQRTDGGDPLLPADNSTWSQRMFSCASGTRARMQRIDFTFNGTMDLSALTISRRDIDTPVLWATEATTLNITDVDLLWGRVADSSEGDPSLQTIRSDVFYVPAGGADIWGVTTGGLPTVLPALAWSAIGNVVGNTQVVDYSGISNYALLRKFQQLILDDPVNGAAQIQKLMWTDMLANTMVGTDTRTMLLIGENVSSVAYDLRYAIPAFLLLLIWLPTFAGATFVLITGLLKVGYLRFLLTHTGPMHHGPGFNLGYMAPTTPMGGAGRVEDEGHWAKDAGRTPVCVDQVGPNPLEYKGGFAPVTTRPSSP
ncbi:hypothetical protein B0H14DRAFT_2893225 [Mycena olivaceomarginata]|nr:hypothetical protein B0H14DRAFT_2893225 [Mycena olivaceomarginata]